VLRVAEETPVSRDIPSPACKDLPQHHYYRVSPKQTPTTTFLLFTPTSTLEQEFRAQEKFCQVISEEFFKSENTER